MGYARKRMSKTADHDFGRWARLPGFLGFGLAQPKFVAVGCVVTLTALGWLLLGLMAAHIAAPLDWWPRAIMTLCQSTFGRVAPDDMAGGLSAVGLMWIAMVLAMMLPSAAPMIMTYAEIADTAGRKGERIVSPLVIAAGYTLVWLGFAVMAAIMQLALARAALFDPGLEKVGTLLSGALFIGAGLYQFSALKHACLRQCRAPFPFFFSHWQTTGRGVFWLGVQQGLFCLGCCWAMMALMFAVGVMNVVWMAFLAVVMTLEKITNSNRLTAGTGAVLITVGVTFVLAALGAQWLS
jgi:predicted metal-binding membrane protein